MKTFWAARYQELWDNYVHTKNSYDRAGKTFPVPDWEERLKDGNQYGQLEAILGNIGRFKEGEHARYVPRGIEEDEKAEEAPATARGSPGMMQRELEDEDSSEAPIARRRRKRKKAISRPRPFIPAVRLPRAPGTSGGAPPPQRQGPEMEFAAERGAAADDEPDEEDPLMAAAAVEEAAQEAYFAQAVLPVRRHDDRLRAEVVQQQNYEALNGVHLMQTDNNVQPVMGAVHIVHPASYYSDKHFMLDMEGDINEGQKGLVKRSKRGPFKDQTGRSTVMDRSAHVTYRKRAGAFEITVHRRVNSSELQQLVSKLNLHRMSVHGSHVVIIKGSKRFRLGPLAELNMKYLLELISECIQQYGTCGLEITESQAGSGALYKGGAYSARFKSNARKGRGLAAAEWERITN